MDGIFPASGLIGCDPTHLIRNGLFQNLQIQDRSVESLDAGKIKANAFVKGGRFTR